VACYAREVTDLFVPGLVPPHEGPSLWLLVRGADLLVADRDPSGVPLDDGPEALGLDIGEPLFLGTLNGVACWAADADGCDPPDGMSFVPLRSLYASTSERRWVLAGRAVQLVEWQRTHRHCGRCGTVTAAVPGERAMRCPACRLLAYPRLAPAIIVLIERGDEALLAHGRAFPVPMYSALAGFVEPGETLEEAVHREVREEVGLELRDVRYFGSQPWPFPHSLMIGFTASWAAGEIDIDPHEIVDAAWFRHDDLPMIPPPMSIARSLIDDFVGRARAAR
jgi:NAD+ diphosphatase